MPELPDVLAYIAALERRVVGRRLRGVRVGSPFVLRSVDPPLSILTGKTITGLRRLGKRIVFEIEGDLFLVLHLMISGRLHWKKPMAKVGGRTALAALDFEEGTLLLTEVSSKKRASLHLVRGERALADFDRGGLEVLDADLSAFRGALARENHTVKRALTDPRLFSGIGNAYSDEILHRARLSPAKWTTRLTEEEIARLYEASLKTLREWTRRFVSEAESAFPGKVTAFREGMAVHGRYGKPCPECGSPVQRIVYAENESNYCATCQTGGKLLADRALSQLLKGDWPRTLEELEERKKTGRSAPLTLPSPPALGGRGDRHSLPLPAGEGRGDGRLLPLPAGEGRGEGRLLPLPAGEGRGEGRLLPLPAGEGRGEGGLLPLPAGEGRGEGRLLPLPAGEGRGEGRLLPLPAGEGRGEGGLLPLPAGEGRGEGRLLPLPAGEGRGEGRLLPLPAGEGRGEGRLLPLPAGEGRGEGHSTRVIRARDLRKRITPAETILWRSLRSRGLLGSKFRRQYPVAGYYLDFYCDEAKLGIELDGGQHAQEAAASADAARTSKLASLGIRVLRFWNGDVLSNLDGVLQRISEALRLSSP